MTISIEFFGIQRMIAKTDGIKMPIDSDTRAIDALQFVKSTYPDLPLEGGMVLITVNQEAAAPDRLLRANDVICFIPGIGGG